MSFASVVGVDFETRVKMSVYCLTKRYPELMFRRRDFPKYQNSNVQSHFSDDRPRHSEKIECRFFSAHCLFVIISCIIKPMLIALFFLWNLNLAFTVSMQEFYIFLMHSIPLSIGSFLVSYTTSEMLLLCNPFFKPSRFSLSWLVCGFPMLFFVIYSERWFTMAKLLMY